jgi:hypothetical protein
MGGSTWDTKAYSAYATKSADKSRAEIFTNIYGCHEDLNPAKFDVRESCDSPKNPNSTPIIIGVDQTGSMGMLAEEIIKKGLGIIVEGIRERKPVPDPHVLLAAIGDCTCDSAPIQTTQFEADVCLVDQIEKFYLEGGGGANNGESYPILWWFALNKTRCDAIIKRSRKGFLFTIGDELPLPELYRDHIKHFLNGSVQDDVNIEDLLADVEHDWQVFHLIVPTRATRTQNAIEGWRSLLGERAIMVDDHSRLGEVIVSIMQVIEGEDGRKVVDSWDKSTALTVGKAISDLAPTVAGRDAAGDITVINT